MLLSHNQLQAWISGVCDLPALSIDWFSQADLSKYKGRYVIIRGRRVVSSGKSPDMLLLRFRRKYPKEIPLLAKILDDDALILVGVRG